MGISLRRTGMTLIEIMMSVMILGLGLLGILSVIPFIEFHSARVVESDFTAAAGTNAFGVIQSHGWEKPATWQQYNDSYDTNNRIYTFSFVLPCFFDLLGERDISLGRDDGTIPLVFPIVNPDKPIDPDFCRCHDDIVVERDDSSSARPSLLIGENGTGKPDFTGAYSWAALMSLVTTDPAQGYATDLKFPKGKVIEDEVPRAKVSMRIDTLVFRGREFMEEYDSIPAILTAIEGTGYQGGLVEIECVGNANEFEKSLNSSSHILLVGQSNQRMVNGEPNVNIDAPFFSAWYKIANFHREGRFFTLTLNGPSFPECWIQKIQNGQRLEYLYDTRADVRAVLFRNLRGVFTRVIPVTEQE